MRRDHTTNVGMKSDDINERILYWSKKIRKGRQAIFLNKISKIKDVTSMLI